MDLEMGSPSKEGDKLIIWPPTILIENTGLDGKDEKGNYKGLGAEEIRVFISGVVDVEFSRVFHMYDRRGHKGRTLVTFPATYVGYYNALSLHECLKRMGKGKEQWVKVKNAQRQEQLVDAGGNKILYGYMADFDVMTELDPQRKAVKRWSEESFEEKVLKPQRERDAEMKDLAAQSELFEKNLHAAKESLASGKAETGSLREILDVKAKEIEQERQREREAAERHRIELLDKERKHLAEVAERRAVSRTKEEEIRARIKESKAETLRLAQEIKQTQRGIDEKQQILDLAAQKPQIGMEHDLSIEMESRFAELQMAENQKARDLQTRHENAMLSLKAQIAKEREELLRKLEAEKNGLDNEINRAKQDTNCIQTQADEEVNTECIFCFEEFGPDRLRALLQDCKHAKLCFDCADKLWKQKNKACPYCKTVQKKKPIKFPVAVFF